MTNVLDELEQATDKRLLQFEKHPEEYEYGGYFVVTDYVCLVHKVLPVLIRIARAAGARRQAQIEIGRLSQMGQPYMDAFRVVDKCSDELDEALEQLHNLGESP